jgi:hypothetical protein
MTGVLSQEGWNLDEFVTAVGIILFSALLMYALAYTMLINPLQRNGREFQFYTGEAQIRRAHGNAPTAAADGEQSRPEGADGDTISSHAEDAEANPDSSHGDGTESLRARGIDSMVQELEKQRRQIETLEAVNDQLCEENERLEAKIAAVSQIVAQA